MTHCLDSWAILAWLDGEESAATVVEEVVAAERPAVSWINLVEVEYRLRRDHSVDDANATLAAVRELVAEELPGVARMRAVATLKAEQPVALGGCFAIATAAAAGATLVTGDAEIVERMDRLPCRVRDARA